MTPRCTFGTRPGLDWAEKYEAAYGSAPPRIERYSDKVKALEALEERERLRGAATRDKRATLYFIGEREARLWRNGLARRGFAVLPRRQAHLGPHVQPVYR